jgi:hypothetical protein
MLDRAEMHTRRRDGTAQMTGNDAMDVAGALPIRSGSSGTALMPVH